MTPTTDHAERRRPRHTLLQLFCSVKVSILAPFRALLDPRDRALRDTGLVRNRQPRPTATSPTPLPDSSQPPRGRVSAELARRRYDGRNGIDTCSSKDQYPFASISTQGRTACSAQTTTTAPPLLLLALAKHGVHSMTPRVRVGKLLCRASADSIKPPPFLPPSPLLFTGRQTCSATLQATAHAVGCRLAWLDCGRSATPPSITQSPLTRGKKRRKRRAARGTCAKEAWQSGAATW